MNSQPVSKRKRSAQTSSAALLQFAFLLTPLGIVVTSPDGMLAFLSIAALCSLPALMIGTWLQRGFAVLLLLFIAPNIQIGFQAYQARFKRVSFETSQDYVGRTRREPSSDIRSTYCGTACKRGKCAFKAIKIPEAATTTIPKILS